MKKVILIVLALIFAMALVVGGYYLFTTRNLQSYVEEGEPCPYSWRELRDGTYRLKVNTAAYPDCSWSVECYPKNVVAATEVSNESGLAEYSILPLGVGQTYVQVYCEQTEPVAVRVFEISLHISVSEDGAIAVEETADKVYEEIAALGEDGDYPIRWWMNPDGVISLLIEEESNGNWQTVDYDPDGLEVTGPFYRQGSCGFEILGKLAGVYPLTIYDGRDKAICLEVQVAEDLTASVTDYAVEAYAVDRSEEHAALEGIAGSTLLLPAEAIVTDYSVKSTKGSVDFLLNDKEWRWQIDFDMTVEELAEEFAVDFTKTKTATVDDLTLTAYGFGDGVMAFWTVGDRTMILYGEQGIALTDVLAVAKQIAEANHG